MRLLNSLSVLLLLPSLACGGEEEPVIPDVSGSYNLVAQQEDSDCLPEVASTEQIWGFMSEAASGIRVMTLEVTQEAGELSAELGPSGCIWEGVVDAAGSVTLLGDCDDTDVARSAHLATLLSPYGSGWEVLGSLSIEIDTLDGEGNAGPDGLTDCVVQAGIEGTGG
jgi:hypothetical protein